MSLFRRTLVLTLGLAFLAPVGLAQAKTTHPSSSSIHLTSAKTKKKHHKKKHSKKHKKSSKKTLAKTTSTLHHA